MLIFYNLIHSYAIFNPYILKLWMNTTRYIHGKLITLGECFWPTPIETHGLLGLELHLPNYSSADLYKRSMGIIILLIHHVITLASAILLINAQLVNSIAKTIL